MARCYLADSLETLPEQYRAVGLLAGDACFGSAGGQGKRHPSRRRRGEAVDRAVSGQWITGTTELVPCSVPGWVLIEPLVGSAAHVR